MIVDLFEALVSETCLLSQVVTEIEREEMKPMVKQILKRISIGGQVSEQKLKDELQKLGLDLALINKALGLLVKSGQLTYIRGGRRLQRET